MLRTLLAALLMLCSAPALALDESELLPVDQAFVLSATATSRERIEIHWRIHEGYYLYRHRTSASADAGFDASGPLQLPPGKRYTDEFFGEVETYRGELTGVLDGSPESADAGSVTLKVRYQGCADAGLCYPPQTRTLSVRLPEAPASGPGLPLPAQNRVAAPALFGKATGTAALPLPEAQAFQLEAVADGPAQLRLRFTPAPGYYLYRDRSRFRIESPAGITAAAAQWPAGVSHHDEHFGNVVVYFDPVDVVLPLHRDTPTAGELRLLAEFQGCQDQGICYPPMRRVLSVSLPAAGDAPASIDTAAATVAIAANAPPADLSAAVEPLDAGTGNDSRSLPPATPPPGTGLAKALLLALLGGLVLNLMPCVLPILSLKALGLAQNGGDRAGARRHALWYTLGVLVSFTAIGGLAVALRSAGLALGWGFQLQQPGFVAALVYLMFGVGLSLSGVFTLGAGLGRSGNRLATASGAAGDFFTGVLACVVASPCIAPFMGGALAYAFTAAPATGLLVFVTLGLGLALPMLLVGFVPGLASKLPRPGAWMETLKQLLAFPMYLTAIWLLWVLGKQRGVDAMALVAAGLALFALALWGFERQRWSGARHWRVLALLLALAALWPAWKVARMPAVAPGAVVEGEHVAWSAPALQALRDEGRVVFVDITADWCVTCKVNEKAVLNREPFRAALRAAGGVYMVGDWTDVDPAISAFLDEYRAVGVPLYVVFPGDGGPGKVLPTVLTEGIVLEAIAAAAQRD